MLHITYNLNIFCSLLKVFLQLRGFTVFLDIEKLNAGKFDEGLLNSVRSSRNFILVLTPNALDRCVGDTEKNDWVHRVSNETLLFKIAFRIILLQFFCCEQNEG